jgi:murein DD-endopeptidase MepM/ murein hydrolase activator NlpD
MECNAMKMPKVIFLSLFLLIAASAQASQGDVFAEGILYQAATYINHPKYGTHPSFYGNPPEQVVDVNIGASSFDDDGMALFAPEDGTVRVVHDNTNAWGYAIEWENETGTERLFMAHLKSIFVRGAVLAGEQIGEIGGTGGWKPHLHIESSQGWLELSGRTVLPPVNPEGHGAFYLSNGPLR